MKPYRRYAVINQPKSRSRLLDAIHKTARDPHRLGFIDQRKMRNYNALCLGPMKEYDAESVEIGIKVLARLAGNPACLEPIQEKRLEGLRGFIPFIETGHRSPLGLAGFGHLGQKAFFLALRGAGLVVEESLAVRP
jgi:hypothetical protein